jgi:hypothetical protein
VRFERRERDDQELGNPVAGLDHERLLAIGVEQQDPQLATVAGVDQARRVDQGDPVPSGEAASRQHQPGVAGRDLDRDPGPYALPLTGAEAGGLAGVQVEPGIAVVGAGRRDRVLGQEPESKFDPRVPTRRGQGRARKARSGERAPAARGR